MANCCSKCTKSQHPPISIQNDLVDIEHERIRQLALGLDVGKGPVKLEGKFKIGFEKESFTRYKRHPPEERGSQESVYKSPMKKEFNIPTELPKRRNSR